MAVAGTAMRDVFTAEGLPPTCPCLKSLDKTVKDADQQQPEENVKDDLGDRGDGRGENPAEQGGNTGDDK